MSLIEKIQQLDAKRIPKVVVNDLEVMQLILSERQNNFAVNFLAFTPPDWFIKYRNYRNFFTVVDDTIPYKDMYEKIISRKSYPLADAVEITQSVEHTSEDALWSYYLTIHQKRVKKEVTKNKRFFGLKSEKIIHEKVTDRTNKTYEYGKHGSLGINISLIYFKFCKI